jgi:transketolase
MGDGEQQEGQVWEAAAFAAHYNLGNLCAVVDLNGLQIDGNVTDVMDVRDLAEKYKAFGWNVLEIDGHNFGEIMGALDKAKEHKGKPTVIIARTVKGKGVSFMEGNFTWHGVAPKTEQYNLALSELTLRGENDG